MAKLLKIAILLILCQITVHQIKKKLKKEERMARFCIWLLAFVAASLNVTAAIVWDIHHKNGQALKLAATKLFWGEATSLKA